LSAGRCETVSIFYINPLNQTTMLKTLILDNGETHELVEDDSFTSCSICSLLDYCPIGTNSYNLCVTFNNPRDSYYKITNK